MKQNLADMTGNTYNGRPYTVCHMMSSIDGRIDCDMTENLGDTDAYYAALDELQCDACLEGRVSMQKHTALPGTFKADNPAPIGREAWHNAGNKGQYKIGTDTHGTLLWSDKEAEDNLLVITDEACPRQYHDRLTAQGISWIACGGNGIDLRRAVQILHGEFGINRLAIVGGGHINAAFLTAGLLDEVSLMVGAGIDGRKGMTAVFDGIEDSNYPTTVLKLADVRRVGENTVWMRYKM